MLESVLNHAAFWPVVLILSALIASLFLPAAKNLGIWPRKFSRISKEIQKDRERTYEQAKRRYNSAKAELSKKFVVVDIVHDLGSDRYGGRDNTETRITMDDAFKAIRDIRKADKNTPVLLVLHTLGGMSLPSMMIAEALNRHKGETYAHIYYIAASGGTLLAMACENIVMDAGARIGPVDTQFAGFSIESWRKLDKVKSGDMIGDEIWLLKMEFERYFNDAVEETKRVTRKKYKKTDDQGKSAVDRLADGSVSHMKTYTSGDARTDLKLDVHDPEKAPASIRKSLIKVRELVDNRLIMISTKVPDGLRLQIDPSPTPEDGSGSEPKEVESSGHLGAMKVSEEVRRRFYHGA